MQGFQNRMERLELKYVIDEATAARVVRQIAPYAEGDSYNLGSERFGYSIQTLYLDSPSLAFHRAKESGASERLKLRLRGYEATRTNILELKQRSGDVIHKTRAVIEGEDLEAAAHGYAKLASETPEGRAFADEFARHTLASGAGPAMLIRYDREAYHSVTDDYARVTFDREIRFQRTIAWKLRGDEDRWHRLDDHLVAGAPNPLVVLELKCGTSVPHWMLGLVQRNDLQRRSFSKYSIGIHLTNWLAGAPPGGRATRGLLV
jgi:SPX domain protein involved in polyphosphate accumulation